MAKIKSMTLNPGDTLTVTGDGGRKEDVRVGVHGELISVASGFRIDFKAVDGTNHQPRQSSKPSAKPAAKKAAAGRPQTEEPPERVD